MTTIIQVPLSKLRPGEKAKGGSINSRKTAAPVDGLAKSIEQHGLLVPLLVRPNGDGSYYVMDGNRRLEALQALAKKLGLDMKTREVPCIEHSHGNALELSMVVNVDREELHPVDRFEVFAALVQAGETVDALSKRYNMKIAQVRQALALGRMAPAVRDAWRSGVLSADMAEMFTVTTDHATQEKVLKKAGKEPSNWKVREALMGDHRAQHMDTLLKFVGRDTYETAGHFINATLFGDEGDRGDSEMVSNLPALRAMAETKLDDEIEKLKEKGWKWAVLKSKAPSDIYSWRRAPGPHTKEQMAEMGCTIEIEHSGALRIERGIVKPGDKVAIPKSPKEKKAATKKREQRQEETGGITNALAFRLSTQLTLAVREAMPHGITGEDCEALAIAVLAAESELTPHLSLRRLGYDADDPRSSNELGKYLKLASSKSIGEKRELLMRWLSLAVDLVCHDGGSLNALLHPDSKQDSSVRSAVNLIDEKKFTAAMRKHFDAKDYFASISKALVVDAVKEAMGKDHAGKVAKMKTADAQKFAIAHVVKTGWLPPALRWGKA